MPRKCVVPTCHNIQCRPAGTRVMFHRLTAGNKERMRRWLTALNMNPNTPLSDVKKMLICSEHFVKDDYFERMQQTTRTMRLILKGTADPSVGIPQRGPRAAPEAEASTSGKYIDLAHSWTHQSDMMSSYTTTSSAKTMLFFPETRGKDTTTDSSALDISMTLEVASDPGDLSFVPFTNPSDSDNGSSSGSTTACTKGQIRGWRDRQWIVSESSLMELFKRCNVCGADAFVEKITPAGSRIQVTWNCLNKHTGDWESCPSVCGK
ncbi:uncharacterized protein LOC115357737 isoform X2 [Myripristis murdjan]|uniref:Uncharacterized LOC115357737 n=1 Tax=Myripristis murdjan TaxID=586833 RepID=A0A667YCQ7_9TELE|nr:uncharacterized protein LOC115357737 isoform X2 [Myripristis murdjan]